MSAAALVQALTEFAKECGNELDDADDLTIEAQTIILCAIRDCRSDLAALASLVERDLMANAGEKRFTVEHVGEVEIKKRTKRTAWRHDDLLSAVIARVMDEPTTIFDPESGELLPYAQIGHNVGQRIRDCVSLGPGKVIGLRRIGLQPDEFCTQEDEGWSCKLPPRRNGAGQ